MRRPAILAFAVTYVVGLVALLAVAATDTSRLVYTIGAGPGGPVAELRAGDEACQEALSPPDERFDRVVVSLGTYFRPGEPVEAVVRSADGSETLSRGRLPAGYPDIGQAPEHAIRIAPVEAGEPVAVCLRNAGRRKVAVYGAPGIAHRTSTLTISGKPVDADMAVRLERSEPRSLLARLPAAFAHAALFKATFAGPWTFWLLAVLTVGAVPLLLAFAVRSAAADDEA